MAQEKFVRSSEMVETQKVSEKGVRTQRGDLFEASVQEAELVLTAWHYVAYHAPESTEDADLRSTGGNGTTIRLHAAAIDELIKLLEEVKDTAWYVLAKEGRYGNDSV
jgi:hypothetical protein